MATGLFEAVVVRCDEHICAWVVLRIDGDLRDFGTSVFGSAANPARAF